MFQFSPVSDRIRRIREKKDVFTGGKYMTLNAERTKIYTDYCKAHDNEFPLLKRAGALYAWCAEKQTNVFDDDVFVGTPGPDAQSLSPYVEWSCDWIPGVVDDTDENFRRAWQTADSIHMSDAQRGIFRDAYDYWKDKTLSKLVEGALTQDFWDEAFGNGCILNGMVMGNRVMTTVSGMPQGHYVANFDKVVNTGFAAVKNEALQKIAAQKGKLTGDRAKSHVFYHAVIRVCDGAMLLSKRYAKVCREKAASASGARQAELWRMADSLEWIMENPARTYWEGLQAILLYELLLITDAQQHGQSMGRVDKYVGHLLKKQLDEGTITLEEAQEYSDAFILRIYDFISLPGFFMNNQRLIDLNEKGGNLFTSIYDGMTATAGIALTLGGVTPDGADDTTPATALLLQTYGRMRLPDPTVALRINKSTPDEIWRLAIESSKLCGGIPQLQNDEIIIASLMDMGFTKEDACNYSIVGCVEPAGTGNEWPACGMTGRESIWNMMDVVQLAINGGVNPRSGKTAVPCKKLYEYESFDEFKAAFETEMRHVLDWNVSYSNMFEMVYSQYFPCIAASAMTEGCIDKGKDVTEGGARYNRTGCTACGTANVADSLMAIKKLCFDDKTVPLKTMYDALQANWEGYEDLRQTVINDVPHYGNDIDEVDELAAWALGLFADMMAAETGPRGNYSGGTFTMTAHIYMGAMLGATPDGRKAGEPIADAISSRQGFDKNGPTAYLRSAAKLPHRKLTNGDQLNIKFTPTSVEGDEGALKLRQLIWTYFRLGGMQVQFNVVSTKALREAQKNPDQYKNLVVRIAGFSTYFVTLNQNTQDDFIRRTEQAL
ncbi:formate C-acetyltransferase [Sporobacter termitidis DSM 10068]|uniref:Formate C-acetyltransferase n=1 Tax=Sporobacter termitidis DSM 10068 TaxID=1123282 RepID=A0A1M5XQ49_9FIRM|nr:pyruvate formate lyase family protein [Sporobacter termitidis]SHI01654.1 formate C-acetyltransferase [Sporobacter termitidis DSM 10068]